MDVVPLVPPALLRNGAAEGSAGFGLPALQEELHEGRTEAAFEICEMQPRRHRQQPRPFRAKAGIVHHGPAHQRDDDADRAAPAAFFGALAAFFADLRAARRANGKRRAAPRRAAAARRPAGATAPPRAGGAVAARLATLKTETADDVLAKLRGPRRARGGRAPAPEPASPAAAPSSAAAGGELLARLARTRGRRRKATR